MDFAMKTFLIRGPMKTEKIYKKKYDLLRNQREILSASLIRGIEKILAEFQHPAFKIFSFLLKY